jgi:hypothetical protein
MSNKHVNFHFLNIYNFKTIDTYEVGVQLHQFVSDEIQLWMILNGNKTTLYQPLLE